MSGFNDVEALAYSEWTTRLCKETMTMEVDEAIRTRRSIRKYEDKKVSKGEVRAILEAARWAPSGLNNQPWRVALAEDRDGIEELAGLTKYGSIVMSAPLLICVFLDLEASYDRDKDVMAIGAFIQNMLLAAHSSGLGAVWLGEILNRGDEVRRCLRVPERYELMAVVAVGYPAEKPPPKDRKPLPDLLLDFKKTSS